MAKKAKGAPHKKVAAKKGGRKQSRKQVERVLSGPMRRPPARPKQSTLPGVVARSPRLDRICASLHDIREQMSDLKGQDAGLISQACRVMQDEKVHLHRAHHIELSLKNGDAKVFARLIKADASSEEEPADTDLDNGEEATTTASEADVPF